MPQNPLGVVYGLNAAGALVALKVDANGFLETTSQPSSIAGAGVTAVNSGTALVAGAVAKSTPGNLYSATVMNEGTVAGWAMVLNSASVPATGTLAANEILDASICGAGSVGGTASFNYGNTPLTFSNGCSLVFSTTAPPVMTTVAGSMWSAARVK